MAITPLVVATVRALSRRWIAIGDNGLILLRAEDVATANHPLLGTWTSASLTAGRNINNPGPLWFDVLAPFVRIGGPSVGLAVGVMVANIAAIVGAIWAAQRTGGIRALVLVTALSAGLAWAMGSELLFDAWQPHALILPFWTLLVMSWGLASGDLWMSPFVVGIASLLVQTHLTFVYVLVVVISASVAMAAAGIAQRASGGRERRPHEQPSLRTSDSGAWASPPSRGVSRSSTSSPARATSPTSLPAAGETPSASASGSGPASSPRSLPSRPGGHGPGSARSSKLPESSTAPVVEPWPRATSPERAPPCSDCSPCPRSSASSSSSAGAGDAVPSSCSRHWPAPPSWAHWSRWC